MNRIKYWIEIFLYASEWFYLRYNLAFFLVYSLWRWFQSDYFHIGESLGATIIFWVICCVCYVLADTSKRLKRK